MEQRNRVRLTPSTSFNLEESELKELYIRLSLFQYRYMRTPDYPERRLIEQLEKDFKKFYLELVKQTEREPNNLMLTRMKTFFEMHRLKLKELAEKS